MKRSPILGCVKLDLAKYYDMVNQKFILHMMEGMSFLSSWIRLISKYISMPSFSILINGSLNDMIKSNSVIALSREFYLI